MVNFFYFGGFGGIGLIEVNSVMVFEKALKVFGFSVIDYNERIAGPTEKFYGFKSDIAATKNNDVQGVQVKM